ncbi:hypothetical protein HPP92_013601 [Vanilla planifolia]|uniref:SAM domain-containing protein n=1 Tax=Vanilla planifolia TaxID=51239 RepID=A0A835QV20_VANPL|nr:hypothetical protein HPP92_013601 [Vanilla planifolia]
MGDFHPSDLPEEGGMPPPPPEVPENLVSTSTSKRQRRPSVRLGEIGEQPAAGGSHDPSPRRPKLSKIFAPSLVMVAKPSSKPRAVAPAARRVRTNWSSRLENGFTTGASTEIRSIGGEDARDEEFVDDSESPSGRNDPQASVRVRVSDAGDEPSEEGFKGWIGGVRSWLEGLGLGRYAPIFEIHEVDNDVLPFLTLEDLRDMGINAVGSRRKIYCAIQKLSKNRDT